MSKHIKLAALIIAVLSIMIFSACNKTEPENVTLETALSVDSSFSGKRTIVCTFPRSIIPANSQQETNLDKVIQKYCPDSLDYTKNISEDSFSYSFQLKFTSATDYIDKVDDITGLQVAVSFSNPDTILASGWKIEENFESSQLLKWIYDGAKQENFDGFDFNIKETKTTAALGDDVHTSEPMIKVNNLSGYPIEKIVIDTVNKKNSVYDRTFIFTISQTTFDKLGSKVSDYFKNITDNSASSADWILENNAYLYTVKFTDVSLKELEGYTNKLLSSVYSDIAYEDKSKGSTPLAEQNCFYETLDFSNYVGNNNGNVPVEYSYSVSGSAELGECMIYKDCEWTPATDLLDTNIYGKKVAIKNSDSLLQLKITDGKQYTASSIDIKVTSPDNDTIQKSITFRYDIATGGNEASDYTKSYFDNLNIGAVQSVENAQNTCTITFSGTDTEINSVISTIFGNNNNISHSYTNPSMTLRTLRQFTDSIDFSSILTGKNADTPVNYYVTVQSGDIIKSLTAEKSSKSENSAAESSAEFSDDGKGTYCIRLNNAVTDVKFDISVPNTADIVIFSIFAVLIVAAAIALIFLFKNKKVFTSLPQSEQNKVFSDKNNKLAKRERNNRK
ncbi:MAG: hypothetical protein PUG48_05600 [Clostridia bacterium]|nr:hypothetical protein [Clostridia bacterium]